MHVVPSHPTSPRSNACWEPPMVASHEFLIAHVSRFVWQGLHSLCEGGRLIQFRNMKTQHRHAPKQVWWTSYHRKCWEVSNSHSLDSKPEELIHHASFLTQSQNGKPHLQGCTRFSQFLWSVADSGSVQGDGVWWESCEP